MREKSRVRKRRACRVIPELDSSYVPCAGARFFCPSTPASATSDHTSRLMRLPPACRGDAGNELNIARSLAQSQCGLLLNRSGPLLRNRLSRRCRRVENIGVLRGCSTSGASCAGPRKRRHPDQSRRTAHDAIRGGSIAKREGTYESIVQYQGRAIGSVVAVSCLNLGSHPAIEQIMVDRGWPQREVWFVDFHYW